MCNRNGADFTKEDYDKKYKYALDMFISECESLRINWFAKKYNCTPEEAIVLYTNNLEVSHGKRWDKVVYDDSVFAFIDPNNGDIYYPASWSRPAKHVRGNIFNNDNGISCVGVYGVKALR